MAQSISPSDEKLYTVKCFWDKEPEKWEPVSAMAFNDNFYDSKVFVNYDDMGNELGLNYIELKVPAGTYNFMTSFYGIYQFDFLAYVIKEKVTVSCDMELKFEPSTATNSYTYEPKTPSGEMFHPSEYYVNEDYEQTLKKQGNITGGLAFDFMIIYKDRQIDIHESEYSCLIYTDDSPVGSYNPFKRCSYRVNEVSDDFTFVGLVKTFEEGEKGRLLYALSAKKPTDDKVFSNNPSNYRTADINYKYSPLGSKTKDITARISEEAMYPIEEYAVEHMFAVNNELNGLPAGWGAASYGYLHLAASNDELSSKVCNIAHRTTVYEYWDNPNDGISNSKNELTWLNLFSGEAVSLATFGLNMLSNPKSILPGNHLLNATMENIDDIFCGTTPAAVAYYREGLVDDYMIYDIGLNFCGRLGESRGVDAAVTSYEFYQDGAQIETVTNSNSLWEWMNENGANLGKTRLTWENPNMEVEGVKAGNSGELCFDAKSDKPWPASLTMLQFRDENNRISSVFPSGEKATIGLSAAGLECYPTKYNFAFTPTKPALVKVEIAPTGTDSFTELTLTEHPDAFYTPGFGSYYTSSLATATAGGWYDVRIRVEESADNYQLQTITRAFKIGERAGIDAPAIDEVADAPVVYYNLMGARVANPERGQILIRVQGTKATKVIF